MSLSRALLAIPALFFATFVSAQSFKDPGNLGPDFHSPLPVVNEMLRAAKVQRGEMVYDLGCGDGRILIAAVRDFGARAVGIEFNRDIYDKTVAHIKELNLDDRIQVIHENALVADLSGADVVTLYLLTSSNDRLKPAFSKLHAGARVVSHDYRITGWKPTATSVVNVGGKPHTIYVYEIQPKP